MSARATLTPTTLSLIAVVTLSCSPDGTRRAELLGPSTALMGTATDGPVAEAGRGKPTVARQTVDETFDGPPGFFCAFAVQAHVVGQVVTQMWSFDGGMLLKSETNVYVTFTNASTSATVTNHQTNASELRIVNGEIVEAWDSGGLVRVVSPGQGIVSQETGHVVVTFDYSTFPPGITAEIKGRFAGEDICALID